MKHFYEYLLLEERVSHRRGEQWRIERARRNRTREERRMRKLAILTRIALIVLLVLATTVVACTTATSVGEMDIPTEPARVIVLPAGGNA